MKKFNSENYTTLLIVQNYTPLIKEQISQHIGKISEFRIQFNSKCNSWLFLSEIDFSNFSI